MYVHVWFLNVVLTLLPLYLIQIDLIVPFLLDLG